MCPTSTIFLTPPYANVYPLYDGYIMPDSPSIDLYSLNNDERLHARRLASSLNSMLESMRMKEDLFFMGAYSSIIAGILENSPICTSRRKVCKFIYLLAN